MVYRAEMAPNGLAGDVCPVMFGLGCFAHWLIAAGAQIGFVHRKGHCQATGFVVPFRLRRHHGTHKFSGAGFIYVPVGNLRFPPHEPSGANPPGAGSL